MAAGKMRLSVRNGGAKLTLAFVGVILGPHVLAVNSLDCFEHKGCSSSCRDTIRMRNCRASPRGWRQARNRAMDQPPCTAACAGIGWDTADINGDLTVHMRSRAGKKSVGGAEGENTIVN